MSGIETRYQELPATSFPFRFQAISTRDGSVVWDVTITGPGRVYVPPLAKMIGCPVTIRLTWPDGRVEEG